MQNTDEYRTKIDLSVESLVPGATIGTVEYFPGNTMNLQKPDENGINRRISMQSSVKRCSSEAEYQLERIHRLADEIVETIPKELLRGLDGGISLTDNKKLHRKSNPLRPLYIMGEYIRSDTFGRRVMLYGGSIRRVFGQYDDEILKRELEIIIKHELTHHLESLSGERRLEEEDALRLEEYEDSIRCEMEEK